MKGDTFDASERIAVLLQGEALMTDATVEDDFVVINYSITYNQYLSVITKI